MLKPIKIGPLVIKTPLLLAPLAGITNIPFRIVCRDGGAGAVWTEMISARAHHFGDKRTKAMGNIHPDEHPAAAQIFGRIPGEMADAATFLAENGADLIDINMGCPVKKVLKSGAGVQLMREPGLAVDIAKAVTDAVDVPVTVKMRLGWSGEEMNYLDIARGLEDSGIDAIILHPRTRVQGFTGEAKWEHIGILKSSVSIPVIGSGDVTNGPGAREMFDKTGCDALMIGRGALGKPWIFDEISAYLSGTNTESSGLFRLNFVQKHIALLIEHLPGVHSVGHLRKHLAWYSKGYPEGATFRREVNRLKDPLEIVALAEEFFELGEELDAVTGLR